MTRYLPVPGSQLGHGCCFEATVVDMTKPEKRADGTIIYDNDDVPSYEVVCECVDMETAVLIASALNAKEVMK